MTDNKKDMRDTYTIYDDQTIGKYRLQTRLWQLSQVWQLPK